VAKVVRRIAQPAVCLVYADTASLADKLTSTSARFRYPISCKFMHATA